MPRLSLLLCLLGLLHTHARASSASSVFAPYIAAARKHKRQRPGAPPPPPPAAARNHSSLDAISEQEARRYILANPDARSDPRKRKDYAKGQTFVATVNVDKPSHPALADEKKAAAAKNSTKDDARRDEDAKRKKAEDDKRKSRPADAAGPARILYVPPPPSAVAWFVIVSAFAWGLVLFARRMGFPMVRKHRKSRMLRRRLRAAKHSKV